jgi:hypothetical protein
MDQSYTIGWLSAFASRMAFPNGIIEINSKPKTYAQCIQNTIMLHTPNSTPAPHPLQLAIYQLFVTTLPFL